MLNINEKNIDRNGGTSKTPEKALWSVSKAVVVGFLVDNIGTLIISTFLYLAYAIYLGTRTGEIQDILDELVRSDTWLMYSTIAIGCIMSFIGGCIAQRGSRRSDYKVAYILATSTCLFGMAVMYLVNTSLTEMLALTVATGACVISGVQFVKQRS
jgi:MFS family permease